MTTPPVGLVAYQCTHSHDNGSSMNSAEGLMEKFGPVEGLLIWVAILTAMFIVNNVLQNRYFKNKAVDPVADLKERCTALEAAKDSLMVEVQGLRHSRGDMLDALGKNDLRLQKEVGRLEVSIEKRATYTWAEDKLLPKIEHLGRDVSQLSSNVQTQIKMQESQVQVAEKLAGSITDLSKAIREHDLRLSKLERVT